MFHCFLRRGSESLREFEVKTFWGDFVSFICYIQVVCNPNPFVDDTVLWISSCLIYLIMFASPSLRRWMTVGLKPQKKSTKATNVWIWGSQVAERWGNRASNPKVARSIPGRCTWRCVLGQGTSPYLPRGEWPCTYCKSLWIRASAKWLNVKCKCKMNISVAMQIKDTAWQICPILLLLNCECLWFVVCDR